MKNFVFLLLSSCILSSNCIDYEKYDTSNTNNTNNDDNTTENSKIGRYGSVQIGPDYEPVQLTAGILNKQFINVNNY